MPTKEKTKASGIIKASDIQTPARIPSGVFLLDLYLGRGKNSLNGWGINRFNILYGKESGGKTTLVLKALANAQNLCSVCYMPKDQCKCNKGPKDWSILFVDGEKCWTSEWGAAHGIDVSKVDIFQPVSVEELIDTINIELPNRNIIVIETLAAILSSDELQSSDDMQKAVGLKARILDGAVQKWISEINKKNLNITFFIENQLRHNITMRNQLFLPQDELESLPGGNWQKYYSSIMVKLHPSKPIVGEVDLEDEDGVVQSGEDIIEQEYRFTITKNKLFMKGEEGKFTLSNINNPSKGVRVGDVTSNESAVAEKAISMGLATKVGDRKIEYKMDSFPYMSSFVKFLKENPAEYKELESKIIDMYEKRHSVIVTRTEQPKEE